METITIGTTSGLEGLRARLNREFRFLAEEGLAVKMDEARVQPWTFLNCRLEAKKKDQSQERVFRYYTASALADLIVGDREGELLNHILQNKCPGFPPDTRAEILAAAQALLESATPQSMLSRLKRRNKVFYRILEFLDSSHQLFLEGLIRFWLKEYYQSLEEAVDQAVEQYLVQKEYQEFVQLLHQFIEIQQPQLEIVHVIRRQNGNFRLLDPREEVIDNEYLEELQSESLLGEEELDPNDLLLSALITIAPRQVVLHFNPEPEVAQTIIRVFAERVRLCGGCHLCRAEEGLQVGVGEEKGKKR